MFVYAKAAASDAVAFRIIESLRRWVIRQGRFAQVVIGIRDIRKIGPFRSEKIEADGIDRYAVKRHKNAVRPSIVEWHHLPLAMRRTIHVVVSIEPINNKKDGFLTEVFMTKIICERGVTCRTIAVVMETVVGVLAHVSSGVTRCAENLFAATSISTHWRTHARDSYHQAHLDSQSGW